MIVGRVWYLDCKMFIVEFTVTYQQQLSCSCCNTYHNKIVANLTTVTFVIVLHFYHTKVNTVWKCYYQIFFTELLYKLWYVIQKNDNWRFNCTKKALLYNFNNKAIQHHNRPINHWLNVNKASYFSGAFFYNGPRYQS